MHPESQMGCAFSRLASRNAPCDADARDGWRGIVHASNWLSRMREAGARITLAASQRTSEFLRYRGSRRRGVACCNSSLKHSRCLPVPGTKNR